MNPALIPQTAVGSARSGELNFTSRPVITADEAFRLLEIDRSTGYKAIREGTFPLPIIRIGRIIRVPTAAIIDLLGGSGVAGVENGD